MFEDLAKGIYAAVIYYKPNQGLQIAQFGRPTIAVFRAPTPKDSSNAGGKQGE